MSGPTVRLRALFVSRPCAVATEGAARPHAGLCNAVRSLAVSAPHLGDSGPRDVWPCLPRRTASMVVFGTKSSLGSWLSPGGLCPSAARAQAPDCAEAVMCSPPKPSAFWTSNGTAESSLTCPLNFFPLLALRVLSRRLTCGMRCHMFAFD